MNWIKQIFVACILSAFGVCGAHAATCGTNQYLSNGECVTCLYNATCNGETYTCNDGFYDGGDSCMACPPNSTCTSPTEFSCVPGTFLHNGVCTTCVNNATCPGGDATFECLAGYYRDGILCRSCAGHVCENGALVSCGAGYFYYDANGKYCMECGPTLYCPAGSTIASVTCVEGYYKSSYRCYKCPDEYYCPDKTATINNYKTYCAAGYYQNGGVCSPCPDGVVCPGHKTQECPDGLFWHDNGQCLSYAPGDPGIAPNCNPGFYDDGGVCATCPVENSTCRSATDFDCVAGFYKNGTKCDICPEYSTCPPASTQISCIPGYYLDRANCAKCAGSNYCADNIRHPCPAFDPSSLDAILPPGHKFIDGGDRTTVWSSTGLITAVTDCRTVGPMRFETPDGFYLKMGPFYDGARYWNDEVYWERTETPGRYLAEQINRDTYLLYKSNNACTNAPENAVYTGPGSPDGNDCPWQCGDGYFRDGNLCTICPSNLECKDGKIICPAGKYASGNSCQDCPGQYVYRTPDNTAPQSVNECQIKCDGGSYVAAAGDLSCSNVGAGFWGTESILYYGAAGQRHSCPAGLTTIGYGPGADSAGDCGRVLHVGNYSIWLHTDKRTTPSLNLKLDNHILYGDMSPGLMGSIRIQYDGTEYSLHNSQDM